MKKSLIAAALIAGMYIVSHAQCDTIASLCVKHITNNYISDGQQYRALLLNAEETAEFHTTLFAETIYRFAACSGLKDGNLIFRVLDKDRNVLFTNQNYRNAPYWDFKSKSTIDVIIEAQLDPDRNPGSGCAVLLIGFKQK
ncbi:MAG: hypothetical protein KatS3mg027_0866 [Bacteroidia bacterium]|nr:MAG: hypothetical protein KatS3mg027_0866 [Bacteroidia bacterium]